MKTGETLDQYFIPEPNSGCWLWTGPLTRSGYGRLWVSGREVRAHRAVYESLRGPIPQGLEPDHICRVRCCVNPDHIEPVTHRVNTQRSGLVRRGTHCCRGHEIGGDNLYLTKEGYRRCRQCVIDRSRAKIASPSYKAERRRKYAERRNP